MRLLFQIILATIFVLATYTPSCFARVEGWMLPGTHVDVILTQKAKAELVAEDVVIDSVISQDNVDDPPLDPNKTIDKGFVMVTVSINKEYKVLLKTSSEDAKKIDDAKSRGTISLMLRPNQ